MSESTYAKRTHQQPPRRVTVLESEAIRRQERAKQDNAKAEMELAAAQDRLMRERLTKAKPVQRHDADAFLGALLLDDHDQSETASADTSLVREQQEHAVDEPSLSSASFGAFCGGGQQGQQGGDSQSWSRHAGNASSGMNRLKAAANAKHFSCADAAASSEDSDESQTSMVVEVKGFGPVQLSMQKIAGRWHATLMADTLEKNQQLQQHRSILERGLSQYVSVPIFLTIAEA